MCSFEIVVILEGNFYLSPSDPIDKSSVQQYKTLTPLWIIVYLLGSKIIMLESATSKVGVVIITYNIYYIYNIIITERLVNGL